jgi:hypothetical protein
MAPTCPDVPLTDLARSYANNMDALRVGGAAEFVLAVLAYGRMLTERIDADRWLTVVAALTEGVDLADVAEAMGEHPEGVRIGLTMWAVDQHSEGSISLTRYTEIVDLVVDVGGDVVSGSGP